MRWSRLTRRIYLDRPRWADPLIGARDAVALAGDWIRAGGSRRRAGLAGPSACARCGIDAQLPGVSLDRHGSCDPCRGPSPRVGDLAAALEAPAAGSVEAIVALSGGKDSLLTLELAASRLGLTVEAVLLDNGFLLPEALEAARAWCARLDVPLTEVRHPLAAAVRAALDTRRLVPWPCNACFDALASALVERAITTGAPRILLGLRYAWPETGSAVARASQAFRSFDPPPEATDVWVINLPLALEVDEVEQRALLTAAGWSDPGLAGHSTNCLLPAYFEREHIARHGRPHDSMRHVAAEVRAGMIDRETAVERMAGRAPLAEHEAEMWRRLEDAPQPAHPPHPERS